MKQLSLHLYTAKENHTHHIFIFIQQTLFPVIKRNVLKNLKNFHKQSKIREKWFLVDD